MTAPHIKFGTWRWMFAFCCLGIAAFGLFRKAWVTPNAISQWRHMSQVEQHIQAIQPAWVDFRRQNAGFELVELSASTGGDGMFGATGFVPSKEHQARLKEFMENSRPPRPVLLRVPVVDPEMFQDMLKSKKSRPETPARATNVGTYSGAPIASKGFPPFCPVDGKQGRLPYSSLSPTGTSSFVSLMIRVQNPESRKGASPNKSRPGTPRHLPFSIRLLDVRILTCLKPWKPSPSP